MASKFLDITGMNSLWAKIKNTFVKKNSNGYVANNQIPVKSYRASSARVYVRICRCKAPTSSTSPAIDCNIRMGDATVRVIIQGYNGWRANVIGYLNNASFKFYAHQVVVGEETFYDIIAYHTTYCRGFYSAQFLYDYDVMDFSYWTAPYTEYTPTSEEEIPYIMLAKSTASSSNAPVKVNEYGDLSPITVDSTPTAGNTANLVSSDGVKTALDGKALSTHSHGNITSDGKIGSTSGYAVYTTTGGALTAGTLATSDPTPSGTSLTFIDSISQDAKGKITPTKKTVMVESTYSKTGSNPVNGTAVAAALTSKVDKMSAWLKTSSGDGKTQWFTLASLNSGSTYNDISGIWDLYLKTRGQTSDGKYVMHALLELSVYTGRYDGTDGTHEQTSPTVRKARLIAEPGWPVEILMRITGKTGNVTVEIMTGNFVAITGSSPCAFYMSERAKSYVNQTREWTYGTYETSDTGSDTRPVSGDNVTVISLDKTGASGEYVYRRTELYEEDVKSEYIPTGTGSDAPVNGKALAAALAGGTASAATATALNMGQLGNAGRPVYIGSDGKPKLCDADIAVFIAEYVPNGTSTPFANILTAYNSGRAIILKTSFCYVMLNGVSLSSGGDITSFVFEGFTGNYIQDFSVNSNNVWAYHSIPLTLSSQGAPNGALGSQSNPLSLVYSASFVGDLTGKADSADKINTDAGSHTVPVYFQNGIPKLSNCRFIYSVDNSGNYSTIQYKLCVGSIGTAPNTFYFT